MRCLEAVNTLPSPVQRSAAGRSSPGLCLPVLRLLGGRRQPREPAGRERGAPGAVPSMRPAPRSLPALLCCCSAGLLLLLLRWRRWKRLWEKVEAARQRQEEGLDRMDKAVRSFREQVGARSRAGRSNGEGEGGRWVGTPELNGVGMDPGGCKGGQVSGISSGYGQVLLCSSLQRLCFAWEQGGSLFSHLKLSFSF